MALNRPKTHMARILRDRLKQPDILVLPGAYNAITAKLIESAGFDAVYVSGAGLINGMTGYPDIGLLSATEMAQFAGYIADAVNVPVICDADTGYGEALQVVRTVQLFEKVGLAGIHLEDQVSPKRCGHLDGKQLISIDAMQHKIRAATAARHNPDFMIIARVDARGVTDFDDAIVRAKAYVAAGADAIFIEALQDEVEFETFAQMVTTVPLLANMTEFGKSPLLSAAQLQAWGYKMVIFPMTLFRVMAKAAETALTELAQAGTQTGFLERMQTRAELYELIDYPAYDKLDKGFSNPSP